MKKLITLLSIFFLLTSCSKKDDLLFLSSKTNNLKANKNYESYLILEYFEYAKKLRMEGDVKNSKFFASKALNILNGSQYEPENPIRWKADKSQIKLMIMMQNRLNNLNHQNVLITNVPIQMAHLNYLYDCWIAKESKSIHISDELARCRVRFTKLIAEIEYYSNDLKRDKTIPVKDVKPTFKNFKIYFDYNNHDLNQRAYSEMLTIIEYILQIKKNYRILLVGNSDRSGSDIYNKLLSLRRVNTVKNILIKNGIANDNISYKAFGEEYPDIITSDGVKKQENRKVDIYIITGEGYNNFINFDVPLIKNEIYKSEINKKKSLVDIE